MKKISISIECGATIPDDGIIEVWWWKEKTYNTKWIARKPMWEFMNPKQVFDIMQGETIEITETKLRNNFAEVEW
jgi:hypothetical protein